MNEIPLSKRFAWFGLVALIQCIYFPTSQATSGGIAPKLAIDVIPVHPIWVVPYYLTYVVWAFGIYWALYQLDARAFRAVIAGTFLTVTIGVLTFIFFPTYIVLPVIPGTDIFSALLRAIQVAGGTHAALPSAHNYGTMLVSAFASHFFPQKKWFWIAVVATISLSTLFTGQHYILDAVSGLTIGFIGYKFGIWWADRKPA
jgi:membrane-associated phospholipid phosphatase